MADESSLCAHEPQRNPFDICICLFPGIFSVVRLDLLPALQIVFAARAHAGLVLSLAEGVPHVPNFSWLGLSRTFHSRHAHEWALVERHHRQATRPLYVPGHR